MFPDHLFQRKNIIFRGDFIGGNHFFVGFRVKIVVLIQHIGDAAAHARRKVFAHGADNHHTASCHIFTAVVAHTLHHRCGAGVPDTEPLTGRAIDEGLAGSSSVECHVADDDIFVLPERGSLGRINHQLSSRQALSEVIIGITRQFQCEPFRDERAETLSAGTPAQDMIGVLLQRVTESSRDLRTEDSAEGAVRVGHVHFQAPFLSALKCLGKLL